MNRMSDRVMRYVHVQMVFSWVIVLCFVCIFARVYYCGLDPLLSHNLK